MERGTPCVIQLQSKSLQTREKITRARRGTISMAYRSKKRGASWTSTQSVGSTVLVGKSLAITGEREAGRFRSLIALLSSNSIRFKALSGKGKTMWNGYKPTTAEKKAIEGAYYYLADCQVGSRNRLDHWMKQERSGYGNRHDAIPAIGAKALCVQWFLEGVKRPDALLRDTFEMRPAAVWLQGLGARKSTGAPLLRPRKDS